MSKKKKKKINLPTQENETDDSVINEESVSLENAVSDVADEESVLESADAFAESEADGDDAGLSDTSDGEKNAEDAPADKEKKSRGTSQAPKLVIILTAICVVVALLLGAVNSVTRGKIAENAAKSKEIAILAIFKDGNRAELYDTVDGKEVYLVYRDEGLVGYCVFLTVTGFGGDIDMTVGINGELSTCGVKIVNMSETPGVGTKVKTPDFLEMFDGLSHEDPLGDVDAISGATISSSAVMNGVMEAHEIDFDFKAVAEKLGVKILTPADILDLKETETESSAPEESEKEPQSADTAAGTDEPVPSATDETSESDPAEQTEDIPYVDNGGEKYYIYGVEVTSVDDRYVLEIKKEDETATFEKETKEPETEKATEKVTEKETEKQTEKVTEKETEKQTEAPTTAVTTTEAVTTAPPVTTAETTAEPQTTVSPETSDTSSSEDTTSDSESSDTTGPVSPDTSDSTETGDPKEISDTGDGDVRSVTEPDAGSDSAAK